MGRAKHHRKVLCGQIQGTYRFACPCGVKHISSLMYKETHGALRVFIKNVINDFVTYTEHACRKTMTTMDVVYALNHQDMTLYHFRG